MADFYKSITGKDNSISVETVAPYLYSKEYREGIRDKDLVAQCMQMVNKILQDETGTSIRANDIWRYLTSYKNKKTGELVQPDLPEKVSQAYSFTSISSAAELTGNELVVYGTEGNYNASHSQKIVANDPVNKRALVVEYAGDLGNRITSPDEVIDKRGLWVVDNEGRLYQAAEGQSGELTQSRLTSGDFVVGTNGVYSAEGIAQWVDWKKLDENYSKKSAFAIRRNYNSENEKKAVEQWEKAAAEEYMLAHLTGETQVEFIKDPKQARQYLIDRMAAAERVKPKMQEYDKAIAARKNHSDIDTILADKSTSYDTKKRVILMLNIRKLK